MNRITFARALMIALAAIWSTALLAAPDSDGDSFFRHRGGVAGNDAKPLPASFGPERQAWRRELPPGHSVPCVVRDQLILTTHDGDELATVSFYLDSGKLRWKRVAPVAQLEPFHPTGSPAASSPASDGERISLDIHSADGMRDVYIYELPRGQLNRLTDTGITWESEWRPDGKRIATMSSESWGLQSPYCRVCTPRRVWAAWF